MYTYVFVVAVSKVQAVSNTGISTGFLGCIKDVQISRQLISIQSELEPSIRKRHEIVECVDNPCARMPCANGGSCQVSHNQGYQCNCKSKFTGRQCQRNRDQCHPNPCQNNGQCIMDDLRGFLCKCGSRYAGRVCQTELYDSDGKNLDIFSTFLGFDEFYVMPILVLDC